MLVVCSKDNQLYWIRRERKIFNTRRWSQVQLRNANSWKSKWDETKFISRPHWRWIDPV